MSYKPVCEIYYSVIMHTLRKVLHELPHILTYEYIKFQIFTAVNIDILSLWHMTPCSVVGV
jgi:hypothetical protein